MIVENPKRLYTYLLTAVSGGLLYDAVKSSIIATGIGALLPDLAFLVKPIMVVLGLGLGATVLHTFVEDFVNQLNKRKVAKKQEEIQRRLDDKARKASEEQQKAAKVAAERQQEAKRLAQATKSILYRFDWLINEHDISSVHGASGQKRLAKASLFVDSLAQLGLIHPHYVKRAKNIKDYPGEAVKHICVVREQVDQKGFKAAKEAVKEWKVPKRTPSRIDTSND